jgi:hypothetical protein
MRKRKNPEASQQPTDISAGITFPAVAEIT